MCMHDMASVSVNVTLGRTRMHSNTRCISTENGLASLQLSKHEPVANKERHAVIMHCRWCCHFGPSTNEMSMRSIHLRNALLEETKQCEKLSRSLRYTVERESKGHGGEARPLPCMAAAQARVVMDLLGKTPISEMVLHVLLRRTDCLRRQKASWFRSAEFAEVMARETTMKGAADLLAATDRCPRVFRLARTIAEGRVCLKISDATAKGCAMTAAQICSLLRESWPGELRGPRFDAFFRDMAFSPKRQKAIVRQFRRVWSLKYTRLATSEGVESNTVHARVGEISNVLPRVLSFLHEFQNSAGKRPIF